jgi:tetratricopeptide (TPR) repeat protein
MYNLAVVLYLRGNLAEAEPLYRKSLEGRRKVLGSRHPDTLASLVNLAALLGKQGKRAEAVPLYREALETSREALGLRTRPR